MTDEKVVRNLILHENHCDIFPLAAIFGTPYMTLPWFRGHQIWPPGEKCNNDFHSEWNSLQLSHWSSSSMTPLRGLSIFRPSIGGWPFWEYGQKFRFRNFFLAYYEWKFSNNFIVKNREIWNWKTIWTDLEGHNHSKEDIPNFEVTPGILANLECQKFPLIVQGGPPGSDARAIILEKKLVNYGNFVIKYFMPPQKIGKNKVGFEMSLFFSGPLYSSKFSSLLDFCESIFANVWWI